MTTKPPRSLNPLQSFRATLTMLLIAAATIPVAMLAWPLVRYAQTSTEAAALHWMFHNRLYSRSGRPRLLAQISSLQVAINRYVLPIWRTVGLSADWDDSHRVIVDALRAGDIDAAVALTSDQIQHAMQRMLDQLPETALVREGEKSG